MLASPDIQYAHEYDDLEWIEKLTLYFVPDALQSEEPVTILSSSIQMMNRPVFFSVYMDVFQRHPS